ncbi:hypothetical protein [Streptomyces thermolilacinus]|uniref:Uncharacterized protein n=1 Tax=Streptomyces thermolilacinus SPC6 TaxID=1306406 RepID=A0A1D3DQ86_9ACTN|nr:hypothetical protein [Streptomyces thermolilacinus]OEJ94501.1 hypothetical protein J116_008495 [Streptomyces thermolilacinus SPC6]
MNDRTPEPEGTHPRPVVCSRCGATAECLPLTWTYSLENDTRHYLCEPCARDHIRSIEGRLDPTWW